MRHRTTYWLTIATAAVAMACSSNPPVTTTTSSTTVASTTTVSGGEVALDEPSGMWIDSVGGTWMDTTGGMWTSRNGTIIGLQPADIGTMTNAHVVAHLELGDSLEVALSQLGVNRAQNSAVRAFAQRMVTEHSAHMQTVMQTASQGGVTPMQMPRDTAESTMAQRTMARLSSAPAGATFDRRFMRDEVIMHQHMLHDLTMARPQASGPTQQLVDQTIPVVRQHLADARTVWRQVGGGMKGNRTSSTNP